MDARKVFRGKHVVVLERDGWEFVERKAAKEAVVVIAITNEDEIILTEQFRRPVNARVIDFPAGMIEEHTAEETARRELEEETGYACDALELLASGPTSAGITSEIAHLYRAKGVRRRGAGGGVGGERIRVHTVGRREIESWLRTKRGEGLLIDLKLWAGLYFV
jgi:ADP-ribose diphosphatase